MATGDEAPKLTVADIRRLNDELKHNHVPAPWVSHVRWSRVLEPLVEDIESVRDRTEVIMGEVPADDKRRLQWVLYELNEAAAAARAVVAYMERREQE